MPVSREKSLSCGDHYDLGPTKGFNFLWLEGIVKNISEACPGDGRITNYEGSLENSSATLTQAGCVALAGAGWKEYPAGDVWGRLTTWKAPLLQLIVLFPLPPLGVKIQFFVICHLMADPIDTIRSLLSVVSRCEYQAQHWKELFEDELSLWKCGEQDQEWKALAIITMSYSELGYDEHDVREKLKEKL
jgi:hypothetical protein